MIKINDKTYVAVVNDKMYDVAEEIEVNPFNKPVQKNTALLINNFVYLKFDDIDKRMLSSYRNEYTYNKAATNFYEMYNSIMDFVEEYSNFKRIEIEVLDIVDLNSTEFEDNIINYWDAGTYFELTDQLSLTWGYFKNNEDKETRKKLSQKMYDYLSKKYLIDKKEG